MTSRLFARITLAGALALSLACEDPLGPSDLAGTYVLRRVGTGELPAKIHEVSESSVWLIADTLVLRPNRSGERRRTIEIRRVDAGVERSSGIHDLHFSTGDRIEIHFGCPRGVACAFIRNPTVIAHRTSDGLLLPGQPGASESLDYVRLR